MTTYWINRCYLAMAVLLACTGHNIVKTTFMFINGALWILIAHDWDGLSDNEFSARKDKSV